MTVAAPPGLLPLQATSPATVAAPPGRLQLQATSPSTVAAPLGRLPRPACSPATVAAAPQTRLQDYLYLLGLDEAEFKSLALDIKTQIIKDCVGASSAGVLPASVSAAPVPGPTLAPLPPRSARESHLFLRSGALGDTLSEASTRPPTFTRQRVEQSGFPQSDVQGLFVPKCTKEQHLWLRRVSFHVAPGLHASVTYSIYDLFNVLLCPQTLMAFNDFIHGMQNGLSALSFRKAFYCLASLIRTLGGANLSFFDTATAALAQRTLDCLSDCAKTWSKQATVALNEAESRRIKTVDPKCGVAREPAELMHRLYVAYFIEAYNFKATWSVQPAVAANVGLAEVKRAVGFALLSLSLGRPASRGEVWRQMEFSQTDDLDGSAHTFHVVTSKCANSQGVLLCRLPSWTMEVLLLFRARVRPACVRLGLFAKTSKLLLLPQDASACLSALLLEIVGSQWTVSGIRRLGSILISQIDKKHDASFGHRKEELEMCAHHGKTNTTIEKYYHLLSKGEREEIYQSWIQETFVAPAKAAIESQLRSTSSSVSSTPPPPLRRPVVPFDNTLLPAAPAQTSLLTSGPHSPTAALTWEDEDVEESIADYCVTSCVQPGHLFTSETGAAAFAAAGALSPLVEEVYHEEDFVDYDSAATEEQPRLSLLGAGDQEDSLKAVVPLSRPACSLTSTSTSSSSTSISSSTSSSATSSDDVEDLHKQLALLQKRLVVAAASAASASSPRLNIGDGAPQAARKRSAADADLVDYQTSRSASPLRVSASSTSRRVCRNRLRRKWCAAEGSKPRFTHSSTQENCDQCRMAFGSKGSSGDDQAGNWTSSRAKKFKSSAQADSE